MPNFTTELLSPAGTLRNMRFAFAYGADAVYAGQPRYSMRVRNNDFALQNIKLGINEAHKLGKRFYLAANIIPHNSKVDTFMQDMEIVIAMGPDALIMADPGLIMLVRDQWPDVDIHLSVQANTTNYAAVQFWQSQGIKRIILSRELSLNEIEDIRQRCPDMELETFVHGSLCIAYSGRCLLSGYFNHRDPNQGTCTNACRWDYKLKPAREDSTGDIIAKEILTSQLAAPTARHGNADDVYVLEQPQSRAGENMPIMEDEHGTYIMNSKDLRAIEYIDRLLKIGINTLKIEGRTKSQYYVARTTQIYRRAMDDAIAGKSFNKNLLTELEALSNRGYTSGFYQRHAASELQNYQNNGANHCRQRYVGEITGYDTDSGMADVLVKNKFCVGDTLELLSPKGNSTFVLEKIINKEGGDMRVSPGSGYQVRIPLPQFDPDYTLLTRQITS